MLADFMGEKDFRTGLMKYMKRFKYGNTVTADLWAVLSEVSGKDVRGMMEAWTKQTGFPILSLEENSSADPNVLTFKASQRRFLQTGISHGDKSIWPAPVNFLVSSSSSPVGSQVFSSPDGTLTVDLKAAGVKEPPTWIKLNAAQAGMYRVRYPPKMFAALCEAVKAQDPLLTPADRLGIQNDAFAFARCGLLPTVQLLQLLEAYENERDYTVWADLVSNLGEISSLVAADSETTALFSVYVNALLKKILASIGWDKKPDEDHTTSLLRAKIIAVSAKHGESSTVQTALQKFAAFYGSGQATASVEAASGSKDAAVTLSPDLRSSVYAAVVKHGGLFGYESLLYLGSKVTLSEEQVRCLNALGAASDPELLRRTLAYVLSPSVRTQDGPSAISIVAANGKGGDLCWEFCKQNWDAILKKFQQSSSLSRIVGQCGNFATRAKKADVEAFFASHAHPGAERAVKQAVERIESNAQWLERDGKAISEYLQKFADAQKKA
jgi:aminopeptidase N